MASSKPEESSDTYPGDLDPFGIDFITSIAGFILAFTQLVLGPLDVTDLNDHFRTDPMDRKSTSGDPNRPPRGGGSDSGIFGIASGSLALP